MDSEFSKATNLQPSECKNYGSAKAYANEVSKWCEYSKWWMNYQHFSMQMSQHYAAMSAFNAMQYQSSQTAYPSQSGVRRLIFRINLPRLLRFLPQNLAAQPQTLIVQQRTIPSFTRRLTAEAIDCCLLFLFKLIVVYLLVEMEIVDVDQFDKILSTGADLQALMDLTQDLFNIEVLCKVLSSILEALFISYGLMNYPRGSTPGKYAMRLAVVSCIDIQPVPGVADSVLLTSLPAVDFKNSLIRSFLKNVVTVFLFPLSTAFYIFQYNRAAYDIAAKTIVVSI